jgi:hypothetical protein
MYTCVAIGTESDSFPLYCVHTRIFIKGYGPCSLNDLEYYAHARISHTPITILAHTSHG